jgi:hypothetical protein
MLDIITKNILQMVEKYKTCIENITNAMNFLLCLIKPRLYMWVKAHYGEPKLVQNESSFLSRKNCELKPFAYNGIMNNILKFSMSKFN